jgi:N-acetylmuramoyl-L-alanine amidase
MNLGLGWLSLAAVALFGRMASEALGATRPAAYTRNAAAEYASVTEWARSHGCEARWLKRDEVLELSSGSARMVLTVDAREARFNGVGIWLLFPPAQRGGAFCLTQLDLATTLRPLLQPAAKSGSVIKSICLDPGHGGKDPGNRVGSKLEKTYTMLLAQEVKSQLLRAGLKVTTTRGSDSFVDLPDRPDAANHRKADLFVSLHFNSTEGSRDSVQGAEVYCLTPVGASSTNAEGQGSGAGGSPGNRNNDRNLLLAYEVQRSLTHDLGVSDRGVRRARFAVLRDAAMPAVLIEGGFMSHPVEGQKIFTPAYRRQMATAIVNGVLAYKRAIEHSGS